MISYFGLLPGYLWRVARRTDTLLGLAALVIAGLGVSLTPLSRYLDLFGLEIFIAVLFFALASYGVFREERVMRSERESLIHLIAQPSSYSLNTRKPAPDEIDIHAVIKFEIWTEIDLDTSALILNLVGIRPRLNLLGKWPIGNLRKTLRGIRPVGQDIALYRKSIRASDAQPFEDSIEFDWRGKLDWRRYGFENSFMELVLITGRPQGTWRAVVDPRLYERGSTKPA